MLHGRRALIDQALLRATPPPLNHAQRSREYARLGAAIIRAHPVKYIELATSVVIAMYVDDLASLAAANGTHVVDARIRYVPVSLILLTLAVIGIVKMNRDLAWTIAATL